jgi:Lrp/AsnC family transcriptional regulator
MDMLDLKLLELLQTDSTLSIAEIAGRIGLSATPCWKRIRKLEEAGIIERRVAILAPDKLGLRLTVFVSIETGDHTPDWLIRFSQAISQMPEVLEIHRMAGDVDYLLKVVVPDMSAYDAFYKRLISTVTLKNVTSRFAMERIKATTALPLTPTGPLAGKSRRRRRSKDLAKTAAE